MMFRNPGNAFVADPRFSLSSETVSIKGNQVETPFIVTVNANQFHDDADIPVNFTKVPQARNVYRAIYKEGVTGGTEKEFLASLKKIKCGEDIKTAFHAYKNEPPHNFLRRV